MATKRLKTALKHDYTTLREVVDRMFDKMRRHDRLILEHDEFVEFAVPVEHRSYWRRASQSTESPYNSVWTWTNGFNINDSPTDVVLDFTLSDADGRKAPLIPINKTLTEPNEAVLAKITSWVTSRWELGRRWGVVRHVLSQLDDICKTPEQVRYYWPAIQTIVNETYLSDLKHRLAAPGDPKAPPLPVELRPLLLDAAATVTGSTLVDPPDDIARVPCEVTFNTYKARRWGGITVL